MKIELLIHKDENNIFMPIVEENITLQTENNVTSILKFNVIKDDIVEFEEGNLVTLRVDGNDMFAGFIFTIENDKDNIFSVTAYDQLRYFKNKDTFKFEDMKASDILKQICNEFYLQVGEIEDTEYVIESLVADNETLIDIVQKALDSTLINKKEKFFIYDDFGKITLKNIANMKLDLLVDDETAENYKYSSSIDSNTYNKIKLIYPDDKDVAKVPLVKSDINNINKWGVLQLTEKVEKGENAEVKANILLELYNRKTKSLSFSNIFGDVRVRAGNMIIVKLKLEDIEIMNYMIITKCKHKFKENEHFMDLTVVGGEINAG